MLNFDVYKPHVTMTTYHVHTYLHVLVLCEVEAQPCTGGRGSMLTSHQQTNQHPHYLLVIQTSPIPNQIGRVQISTKRK